MSRVSICGSRRPRRGPGPRREIPCEPCTGRRGRQTERCGCMEIAWPGAAFRVRRGRAAADGGPHVACVWRSPGRRPHDECGSRCVAGGKHDCACEEITWSRASLRVSHREAAADGGPHDEHGSRCVAGGPPGDGERRSDGWRPVLRVKLGRTGAPHDDVCEEIA